MRWTGLQANSAAQLVAVHGGQTEMLLAEAGSVARFCLTKFGQKKIDQLWEDLDLLDDDEQAAELAATVQLYHGFVNPLDIVFIPQAFVVWHGGIMSGRVRARCWD